MSSNENTKPFKNPYLGCVESYKQLKKAGTASPLDRPGRINADVAGSDFRFLQQLRIPDSVGTTQTIVNLLWQKLCYECRKRGITSIVQQEQFEHFVANCILRLPGEPDGPADGGPIDNGANDLPGGTPPRVVGERRQDVRSGASGVGGQATPPTQQQASVPKSRPKGKGKGRKGEAESK